MVHQTADASKSEEPTSPRAGGGPPGLAEGVSPSLSGEETSPPPELFLSGLVESLLFVADEPVTPGKLAQALERSEAEVQEALAALQALYQETGRGLRIQERNGRVQLVTAPAAAQAVENFLNLDLTTRLSGPALETLAIVAYRQPVTRAQIEAVRGVDCSGVLRKLLHLGLVEEVGRLETVGRPILYGVTDQFMQHFGLISLEELPPLPAQDADALVAATELAEETGEMAAEEVKETEEGGRETVAVDREAASPSPDSAHPSSEPPVNE